MAEGKAGAARSEVPQLIGVLRGDDAETVLTQAAAALEAGLASVEITFTVPDAAQIIQQLRARYPKASLGAGTLRSPAQLAAAAEAGSSYLVSPHLDKRLVAAAQATGLPYLPGVATPSEVAAALSYGCEVLKVFPIVPLGGAAYLSSLLGPFPELRAVVTGGVNADNAADFLNAGAVGVGLGTVFAKTPEETQARVQALLRDVHGRL